MCMTPEEARKLYEPAKAERFSKFLKECSKSIVYQSKNDTKFIYVIIDNCYDDVLKDVGLYLKNKGWHVKIVPGSHYTGRRLILYFDRPKTPWYGKSKLL